MGFCLHGGNRGQSKQEVSVQHRSLISRLMMFTAATVICTHTGKICKGDILRVAAVVLLHSPGPPAFRRQAENTKHSIYLRAAALTHQGERGRG